VSKQNSRHDLKILGPWCKYFNVRFENVAIPTDLTIHAEIKSRLNSWNVYYHSVQTILSSCLQSKYMKIKIYRSIILSVACETWSLCEDYRVLREDIWAYEKQGNTGM
jgi:hypothetical protein